MAVDVWKGRRVTQRRHRQRATQPRTPTLQVSTRVRSVSFEKLWWERDAADDLDGWGSTARQPERHKERRRGGGSSHQKKKTLQRSESYILTFFPPRGNQGPRHKVLCPNFHNKLVTRTGQEPRAPGSTVLGPSPQSLPGHAARRNSVLRDVKCLQPFSIKYHDIDAPQTTAGPSSRSPRLCLSGAQAGRELSRWPERDCELKKTLNLVVAAAPEEAQSLGPSPGKLEELVLRA